MQRTRRTALILGLLASMASGPLTARVHADGPQDLTGQPQTLTLFESTAIYDQFVEVGRIAPQQVQVLEVSKIRRGHGEGYLVPMYRIPTWLGERWIIPDNALRGSQMPLDVDLELSQEEKVYADPGLLSPTGTVGKQTARAVAQWDGRYQIQTPGGTGWIAPRGQVLAGIKPLQTEVALTAPNTRLFRFPRDEIGASITPQKVHVTGVWRDWYRADSWLGPVWFRLHEGDAVDRYNDIEVGLGLFYLDEKETRFQATVRLGPTWRDTGETVPVGFRVVFYNDKGERISTSSGAALELRGSEPSTAVLTADPGAGQYALATIHIGMLNHHLARDISPADPMSVTDPAHTDLRLGAIQVRQEGAFSIVNGQYTFMLPGEHRVEAQLSFADAEGKVIAEAPLSLDFDASYSGKASTIGPFEVVLPADVTGYASAALKVVSVK
ncbi:MULTISPECIES: hypothetical protein [Paenibacillus]|uniref:hypothetical protein n=1 Tax=Paenibacillus TaxID=44249 RepID=UPI0022B91C53|nr:hypothetical protein [Paenibacillus caseinilyticus]MCZ8520804.1 hypothetical protein [Paenibacillus caseinilyticus]